MQLKITPSERNVCATGSNELRPCGSMNQTQMGAHGVHGGLKGMFRAEGTLHAISKDAHAQCVSVRVEFDEVRIGSRRVCNDLCHVIFSCCWTAIRGSELRVTGDPPENIDSWLTLALQVAVWLRVPMKLQSRRLQFELLDWLHLLLQLGHLPSARGWIWRGMRPT